MVSARRVSESMLSSEDAKLLVGCAIIQAPKNVFVRPI